MFTGAPGTRGTLKRSTFVLTDPLAEVSDIEAGSDWCPNTAGTCRDILSGVRRCASWQLQAEPTIIRLKEVIRPVTLA